MSRVDALNGAGTSQGEVLSGGSNIDWSQFTAKLPVGRDTASALRRSELFSRFDVNQNGVLS